MPKSVRDFAQAKAKVSIRTPPEGGVMHEMMIDPDDSAGRSFNPHPARRRGDALVTVIDGVTPKVSIRTPPEGGVMPPDVSVPALTTTGFNPHPARRRGDALSFASTTSVYVVSIRTPPEGGVMLTQPRRTLGTR